MKYFRRSDMKGRELMDTLMEIKNSRLIFINCGAGNNNSPDAAPVPTPKFVCGKLTY